MNNYACPRCNPLSRSYRHGPHYHTRDNPNAGGSPADNAAMVASQAIMDERHFRDMGEVDAVAGDPITHVRLLGNGVSLIHPRWRDAMGEAR